MNAEEFYDWCSLPDNDDFNWELDRGQPVQVPFGSRQHGFVCANVGGVLGNFVYPRRCGYLCSNNTGVIVERNPDSVLGPDLLYFRESKSLKEMSWFFVTNPPQLAVEVLAPEDSITRMSHRIERFLGFGVSSFWLVDPQARAVTIYQPAATICVLKEDNDLSGGSLLPGFCCQVGDLFELPGQHSR